MSVQLKNLFYVMKSDGSLAAVIFMGNAKLSLVDQGASPQRGLAQLYA